MDNSNRPPPITTPEEVKLEQDLADFDAMLTAPLDKARRDAASQGLTSSKAFEDYLRWLVKMAPQIANRYAAQMTGDELIKLVDPRQPDNLYLLMKVAPDLICDRVTLPRVTSAAL